jgi:hypothetical protein
MKKMDQKTRMAIISMIGPIHIVMQFKMSSLDNDKFKQRNQRAYSHLKEMMDQLMQDDDIDAELFEYKIDAFDKLLDEVNKLDRQDEIQELLKKNQN